MSGKGCITTIVFTVYCCSLTMFFLSKFRNDDQKYRQSSKTVSRKSQKQSAGKGKGKGNKGKWIRRVWRCWCQKGFAFISEVPKVLIWLFYIQDIQVKVLRKRSVLQSVLKAKRKCFEMQRYNTISKEMSLLFNRSLNHLPFKDSMKCLQVLNLQTFCNTLKLCTVGKECL